MTSREENKPLFTEAARNKSGTTPRTSYQFATQKVVLPMGAPGRSSGVDPQDAGPTARVSSFVVVPWLWELVSKATRGPMVDW